MLQTKTIATPAAICAGWFDEQIKLEVGKNKISSLILRRAGWLILYDCCFSNNCLFLVNYSSTDLY